MPNFNPSPQSELLKDPKAVASHHLLVENLTLRKHLEIALLEMQRRAAAGTDTTNFNFCAASHLRLLGAQDFLSIFFNLAEEMKPGVRTDTTNLPANMVSMPSRKN